MVRMNTWKRTTDNVTRRAEHIRTKRELLDHLGSAFMPEYLMNLARQQAPTPGQPIGPGDDD
jgi:hypothetical protein